VKFNTEYEDETYSAIPTLWLRENEKYSYWPRKDTRNCIIKCKEPQDDWIVYPVSVIAKYGNCIICNYIINNKKHRTDFSHSLLQKERERESEREKAFYYYLL